MGTFSSEFTPHLGHLADQPRIYADANIPIGIVEFMRTRLRWDVLFVLEHEELRRARDIEHYRLARQLGRVSGVEVVQVVEGSPAAEAGLRPEDLVVELDGSPVTEVGDIQRLMVVEKIGAAVPLRVLRGGQELELALVPAELDT